VDPREETRALRHARRCPGLECRASGELVYVNADPKTKKSAPWPEPLERAIFDYERTPPETKTD